MRSSRTRLTNSEIKEMRMTENRYKSQKTACLAYLKEHGSITPMQALEEFGCFRLAVVISRLRADGHSIFTDINDGEPKFAIYRLME